MAGDDKDDIYEEGGVVVSDFLRRLSTATIPPAFVAQMVAVSPAALTATWKGVLRTAFEAPKRFSFTADLDIMRGQLAALAALTAHNGLLRLVAAELMGDVVTMNKQSAAKGVGSLGRSWEGTALLAPLLSVSGWLDPKPALAALRGSTLQGPLPDALRDVRGYPARPYAPSFRTHGVTLSLFAPFMHTPN